MKNYLKCKKPYLYKGLYYFTVDRVYEFSTIFLTLYMIEDILALKEDEVKEHFYSEAELRQMKIKKLLDN